MVFLLFFLETTSGLVLNDTLYIASTNLSVDFWAGG